MEVVEQMQTLWNFTGSIQIISAGNEKTFDTGLW